MAAAEHDVDGHEREATIVQYPIVWRILAILGLAFMPFIFLWLFRSDSKALWKVGSFLVLLLVPLGFLQMVTYRLTLTQSFLKQESLLGRRIFRSYGQITKLTFFHGQKLRIYFDTAAMNKRQRFVEELKNEFSASEMIFDIPAYLVNPERLATLITEKVNKPITIAVVE